ncbi:hypothetical protein DEDE109153_13700 [Deinococcus deserti]|uniref:Uncharacterized protein n=1 Tax=Deinococcus deserti (strain DSM 17065 / CIP 109153 / LMG 22923 / VCD115) TaxID=546414 RepID=C1D2X0_DEIDV|nr:hypothetical protein [Deinococcus deserti]ACO47759.1 Hypothetical protein Deide_2p00920 [Deinococcus deserti VCD115]
MNDVMLSVHAVERFQERFAGNLSWSAARDRLRRARFMGVRPGRARMYSLGDMRFIVQDGMLITVYRQTYTTVPVSEDLWCLSALEG